MTVEASVGRPAGISYLHIPARDPAASATFYRGVFGWQLHGDPARPSFADGTGHVIGRWVTDQASAGADGLRAYVYVADVPSTLAAITEHGGRVVRAPYPEDAAGGPVRRSARQRPRRLAGDRPLTGQGAQDRTKVLARKAVVRRAGRG